jgi:hypothetical protein
MFFTEGEGGCDDAECDDDDDGSEGKHDEGNKWKWEKLWLYWHLHSGL